MSQIDALSQIRRGTNEIISEEELVKKLNSGKKLRIKLGVDPTTYDDGRTNNGKYKNLSGSGF